MKVYGEEFVMNIKSVIVYPKKLIIGNEGWMQSRNK